MTPPEGLSPRNLFIFFIFLFIIIGCNLGTNNAPAAIVPPTPTNNPLFDLNSDTGFNDPNNKVTQEGDALVQDGTPLPTLSAGQPAPTRTPIPTPVPTPTMLPPISIFDESLHPDWEMSFSSMEFNDRYNETAYSGIYSIQANPRSGREVLFFGVKEDAARPYLREEILGISMRIYSGDGYLATEDLAITVMGSPKYPFFNPFDETITNLNPNWEPEDDSITGIYDYAFSPTRLAFLGVLNDVPPKTWVWVTNWLDDRIYDLDYEYVTGIYIKNDDIYSQSFLVDEINIILAPPESIPRDSDSP